MTAARDLLGYEPDARLDAQTALKLAALPIFSPDWAICPAPSGRGVHLMRSLHLTAAQREAAQGWAEKNRRRIAKAAPPVLAGVSRDLDALTFETLGPDGGVLALTLEGVKLEVLGEHQKPAPVLLTVSEASERGPLLALYTVKPDTTEGQAALIALGYAGPYPVPSGASIAGHSHGQKVSEGEAYRLTLSPDFEGWGILPSADGSLRVMWTNALTAEGLQGVAKWTRAAAAQFHGASEASA